MDMWNGYRQAVYEVFGGRFREIGIELSDEAQRGLTYLIKVYESK